MVSIRSGIVKWRELRFWYSERFRSRGPEGWRVLYDFKRNSLLPILERYNIHDFLILDEPEFVLLRIEVDEEKLSEIKRAAQSSVEQSPDFTRVTVVDWSPEADARTRILGARERAREMGISFLGIPLGGWKITGRRAGRWIAAPDDLERKTGEFARFMSRVAGRFTRAYLQEIPQGVDDRWLLSVFIHLLLDSVSVWQRPEKEARAFPFI